MAALDLLSQCGRINYNRQNYSNFLSTFILPTNQEAHVSAHFIDLCDSCKKAINSIMWDNRFTVCVPNVFTVLFKLFRHIVDGRADGHLGRVFLFWTRVLGCFMESFVVMLVFNRHDCDNLFQLGDEFK